MHTTVWEPLLQTTNTHIRIYLTTMWLTAFWANVPVVICAPHFENQDNQCFPKPCIHTFIICYKFTFPEQPWTREYRGHCIPVIKRLLFNSSLIPGPLSLSRAFHFPCKTAIGYKELCPISKTNQIWHFPLATATRRLRTIQRSRPLPPCFSPYCSYCQSPHYCGS